MDRTQTQRISQQWANTWHKWQREEVAYGVIDKTREAVRAALIALVPDDVEHYLLCEEDRDRGPVILLVSGPDALITVELESIPQSQQETPLIVVTRHRFEPESITVSVSSRIMLVPMGARLNLAWSFTGLPGIRTEPLKFVSDVDEEDGPKHEYGFALALAKLVGWPLPESPRQVGQ